MSIFHTNKIRTRAGIYTISEEEGVTPYDDDGVEVPPCRLNLSEYPLKELKETVDPVSDRDNFGIDLYERALVFL